MEIEKLIETLEERFQNNMHRHENIEWVDVLERIKNNPDKLKTLYEMEITGGEPDVVGFDDETGEYIFYDCSPESPEGRRSLCYDDPALEARKNYKPEGSAVGMAQKMGIELLTKEEYRYLQTLGSFDTKTSTWIKTPVEIRKLGGSLFCDRRYNAVFTYHNGADSYYASRGFRGKLKV